MCYRIAMLENLIEYFNKYAFTQVAIYGKSFVQAAKDTWTLVKSHGIDAMINDQLIGNVLGISALLVGILTGAASYALVHFTTQAPPVYQWVAAVGGLFIGFSFQNVMNEIITSGVATTFVKLSIFSLFSVFSFENIQGTHLSMD